MSSSTSAFRSFAPLLTALAFVALVEITCAFILPASLDVMKSPLLHMAYRKSVRIERLISAIKLHAVMPLRGNILQIGDSSGLVSVTPSLVNAALPAGLTLLNLSMQAPVQFIGHMATAEVALNKHPDARYLLLMVSPYHLGRSDEGFGEEIEHDYAKLPFPWLLPSLKVRALAVNTLFYGDPSINDLYGADDALLYDPARMKVYSGRKGLTDNFWNMSAYLRNNHGDLKLDTRMAFTPHTCVLTGSNMALADERLEAVYRLTARHHVGLILVLGPIKCTPSSETAGLEKTVTKFLARHPDVIAPLPIIDVINPALLGDDVHVTAEGNRWFSQRLGQALGRTIH